MKRCLLASLVVLSLLLYPASVLSHAAAISPSTVPHETPVKAEVSTPSQSPLNASRSDEPLETPLPSSRPLTASQAALREAVDEAFADTPAMDAVVRCESHYRQFDRNGEPLWSPTHDVGVMQINWPTWGARSIALGLDIKHSAADNIAMARIVLKEQGIGAWTCAD